MRCCCHRPVVLVQQQEPATPGRSLEQRVGSRRPNPPWCVSLASIRPSKFKFANGKLFEYN